MPAFRAFELQAIGIMAEEILSDGQLRALRDARPSRYEYTGSGYFLTVQHPSLPADAETLSEPAVVGTSGRFKAGFVVFLGNHELTLECHTWGEADVPASFRDQDVSISTAPETTK
jgi:hypothetical protein